jgi:quercetin dioxygenase-like cupin family protein
MKWRIGLLALMACCAPLQGQAPEQKAGATGDQPVAMKDEPHHHLLWENPYVRLYRIEIPANTRSLLHKHEFPYISISQGANEYTSVVAGQPDIHKKRVDGEAGYSNGGVVHFIRTDAGLPFNMLDVDLLYPQGTARNLCDKVISQDFGLCDLSKADQSEGISVTPSFETDAVRVERLQIKRGETHDEIHEHPGLLIMVGGSTVAVSRIPGVMTQFMKPGDTVWIPRGGQPKFTIEDGADAQLLLLTFKGNEPSQK